MKKNVCLYCLIFVLVSFCFGQNSAQMANKTTAVRCLKLAESCLAGSDWKNALSQSELGLSYDDSISDLFYVKAAAKIKLNTIKAEVLEIIEQAFEKDNWVDYTKTGARILYADLLSDTGDCAGSLQLLDEEPYIYSADAEVIRIKNYYRLGDADSVSQARNRINAARRIYSSDLRFMQGFFYHETYIKLYSEYKYQNYETPELVQTIAESYIKKLPDYSGKYPDLELCGAFFATGDVQKRLVKAIDAKEMSIQPVLAIVGLKTGLYSEQQAFDLFFATAGNKISFAMLKYFIRMISSENVKNELIDRLTNSEYTILFDKDIDLQNELEVQYKYGRPYSFTYDANNDGRYEYRGKCDLGTPTELIIGDNFRLEYGNFPYVSEFYSYEDTSESMHFSFLDEMFAYKGINVLIDEELLLDGINFYVPELKVVDLSFDEVRTNCSKMELPVTERPDAKVCYDMYEGNPVSANFYEGDKLYALCNFQKGLPFVRFVDYDQDGYFETAETFNIVSDELVEKGFVEESLIADIFNSVANGQNLYLQIVQIDRNGNTHFEFSEEYTEKGDKITSWDNDDDGVIDCQHICYSDSENNSKVEVTSYYNKTGELDIALYCLNSVPVKLVNSEKNELIIYAGTTENLYWIEEAGTTEMEISILSEIGNNFSQGEIKVVQVKDNRISAIRIEQNIFLRILAEETQVETDED